MRSFGITDKGRVRPTNQDTYQIRTIENKETAVLIVCDGMGGANAGNVASKFAAAAALEIINPELETLPIDEIKRQQLLQKALETANATVWDLSTKQPEFHGMGTTLVIALIQKEQVTLLNVGDSRAYVFDGQQMIQLTEDHSYVEEMRRQGRITAEDAKTHPQKNLITRAVGVDTDVEGDLFEVVLQPGEILLLCTDGLTGMLEDADIAMVLKTQSSLEEAARELLNRANANGGRDNITVALYQRNKREGA